jgi:signal transduction histidine kinase
MLMIFRSFYAKLSLIFLILILALGAGSLAIAFSAARHLFDETEQLLNREYASSIALELQPMVVEGFSESGIKNAIHYMMVLNPMVEIYLIDAKGTIKAYFTHPAEKLSQDSIDLVPLEKFISSNGFEPVLGEDPRTGGKRKPFSAAPLLMGEDHGYVYVILRGQSYDRSFEMLRSSYYIRTGLSTFFFAFLATLIVGLFLFFFLTRRLRHLSSAVKAFEAGKYDFRVAIRGSDELGALARAFNEMATSIEAGIENLHQAEHQRSDLITNISHDLRSPLTSIRGHLETMLLKDMKMTDKEGREFLEISLKNVSSFQKLVEELFELAKLETHQIKLRNEAFQIAELVQDVALKIKPSADFSLVTITIDQPEKLSPINGDIGMIERVLTNLLENAIAHTPEKGQVNISIVQKDEELLLTVSDTGSGIAQEDLPHIFERFYRADKSRDRRTPGTGLGLAITKEIVGLHSGRIEADSPEGKGAVFRIFLPL